MASNTSVYHYQEFIVSQVKSGRYSSASEVVRSALSLLEEEEKRKSEFLRGALKAGEESGLAVPCDSESFRKKMFAKYVERNV
jgi:antitoxin ParD1/3/4